MKRNLLSLLVLFIGLPSLMLAQSEKAPFIGNKSAHKNLSVARQPSPTSPTRNALFDLQFDYTLTVGGCAGITWTDHEFWVSKWQSDTLFIVDDSTGALLDTFTIAGLTAVRGMTFDGKSVYATDNSSIIYKIDTATKSILRTFVAPIAARGIAFDSSANSGAGGFWIGNFDTDIMLIDTSGNLLSSILATTHGLVGMYSLAFDPYSTGGPYVWAFDQGTAGTAQNLVRIAVATGIIDVTHDVGIEIGGAGISGGLNITGFGGAPTHTILGLSQDSPDHVFGLELGDFSLPPVDAAADTLHFFPANTATPSFLLTPINWEVVTTNEGANTLDTLFSEIVVNDGTTDVFNESAFALAVPSHGSATIPFANTYTPATQVGTVYTVTNTVNAGVLADPINSNDTLSYSFTVTDTSFRRHTTPPDGSVGIGGGFGGSIGLMYDIPVTAYAASATFTLASPTLGDSVFAELYDWNGTTPDNLIAVSAKHVITAPQTTGVVLTLQFLNAPIQLNPGTYIVAIREGFDNVSISYSFFNWRANSAWIFVNPTPPNPALGWLPSEDFTFNIVPFIQFNVYSSDMVSVKENENMIFTISPNPASSQLNFNFPVDGDYNIMVTDIQGKVVYQNILQGRHEEVVPTNDWDSGIYITKVESNGKTYHSKVVVSH